MGIVGASFVPGSIRGVRFSPWLLEGVVPLSRGPARDPVPRPTDMRCRGQRGIKINDCGVQRCIFPSFREAHGGRSVLGPVLGRVLREGQSLPQCQYRCRWVLESDPVCSPAGGFPFARCHSREPRIEDGGLWLSPVARPLIGSRYEKIISSHSLGGGHALQPLRRTGKTRGCAVAA